MASHCLHNEWFNAHGMITSLAPAKRGEEFVIRGIFLWCYTSELYATGFDCIEAPTAFVWIGTLRIGQGRLEGGVLALQSLSKDVQVKHTTAQGCLRPGVKLLWLAGAHHRPKTVCL